MRCLIGSMWVDGRMDGCMKCLICLDRVFGSRWMNEVFDWFWWMDGWMRYLIVLDRVFGSGWMNG